MRKIKCIDCQFLYKEIGHKSLLNEKQRETFRKNDFSFFDTDPGRPPFGYLDCLQGRKIERDYKAINEYNTFGCLKEGRFKKYDPSVSNIEKDREQHNSQFISKKTTKWKVLSIILMIITSILTLFIAILVDWDEISKSIKSIWPW